jgi:GNAT superfamily N-acetyltransferase
MSFGMMAVDAVRDTAPIEAGGASIDIRKATSDEIPEIVGLNQEFGRYMASAPIFLPLTQKYDARYYQEWLADSDHHLWLAYRDDEAVGYIKLQKWAPEVCLVTQDDRAVSIVGAFAKERFRGHGVGTALLSQILSWARSMGFERCAVDFEPQNPLATAFWLRYFRPVCYSVVCHVSQQISWAHSDRNMQDMW